MYSSSPIPTPPFLLHPPSTIPRLSPSESPTLLNPSQFLIPQSELDEKPTKGAKIIKWKFPELVEKERWVKRGRVRAISVAKKETKWWAGWSKNHHVHIDRPRIATVYPDTDSDPINDPEGNKRNLVLLRGSEDLVDGATFPSSILSDLVIKTIEKTNQLRREQKKETGTTTEGERKNEDMDMDVEENENGEDAMMNNNTNNEIRYKNLMKNLEPDMDAKLVWKEIEVGWEFWSLEQILSALFPLELQKYVQGGFTNVGHIAHFNLHPESLPFKHIIGQVVLEKHPSHLKTVVNKLENVGMDSEFRTFQMEVLAGEVGEGAFQVEQPELFCKFQFDFSKVYFNSRLEIEHKRMIVDVFRHGDVVVDLCAGVGPFAIPAAKLKRCGVIASDLNPHAYESLVNNIKLNKVEALVSPFNRDMRSFIPDAVNRVWRDPFPSLEALDEKEGEEMKKKGKSLDGRGGGSPAAKLLSKVRPYSKPNTKKEARRRKKPDGDENHQRLEQNQGNLSTSIVASKSSGPTPSSSNSQASPHSYSKPRKTIDHFVMNLPGAAIDFLDGFRGCYRNLQLELLLQGTEGDGNLGYRDGDGNPGNITMPMIHCYCFTKEDEVEMAENDILERASRSIGYKLTQETRDYDLYYVRRVAPRKDMYCLSFRLPEEVAFATPIPSS